MCEKESVTIEEAFEIVVNLYKSLQSENKKIKAFKEAIEYFWTNGKSTPDYMSWADYQGLLKDLETLYKIRDENLDEKK